MLLFSCLVTAVITMSNAYRKLKKHRLLQKADALFREQNCSNVCDESQPADNDKNNSSENTGSSDVRFNDSTVNSDVCNSSGSDNQINSPNNSIQLSDENNEEIINNSSNNLQQNVEIIEEVPSEKTLVEKLRCWSLNNIKIYLVNLREKFMTLIKFLNGKRRNFVSFYYTLGH